MKRCLFFGLIAVVLGISGTSLATDTWTAAEGDIDLGQWAEAYGTPYTPGSPGSELLALCNHCGPTHAEWGFSGGVIPVGGVTPLDPSDPWEYETIYQGGTLALDVEPSLWGAAISIPMTLTNYSRHDPAGDLEFYIVGTGTAGGYDWTFEASFSGDDYYPPDDFAALWAFFTGEIDKTGHKGVLDWIRLTRSPVPVASVTWTAAQGDIDLATWAEAYGTPDTPGSPGSELFALCDTCLGTDLQWFFAGAVIPVGGVTPLDPSDPWEYETIYQGGTLALGEELSLWGAAINIPVTVTNYSRHDLAGDLEFHIVGTGTAGGYDWTFEATFSGDDTPPSPPPYFENLWAFFHPGDTGRTGHMGHLDWVRLTRSAPPTVTITNTYTTDEDNNPLEYFYVGEIIRYHIDYTVTGASSATYDVKAKIKPALGPRCPAVKKLLRKKDTVGPGTHHMYKERKIPRCAKRDTWRDVRYRLNLKTGTTRHDYDKATSQIVIWP